MLHALSLMHLRTPVVVLGVRVVGDVPFGVCVPPSFVTRTSRKGSLVINHVCCGEVHGVTCSQSVLCNHITIQSFSVYGFGQFIQDTPWGIHHMVS